MQMAWPPQSYWKHVDDHVIRARVVTKIHELDITISLNNPLATIMYSSTYLRVTAGVGSDYVRCYQSEVRFRTKIINRTSLISDGGQAQWSDAIPVWQCF